MKGASLRPCNSCSLNSVTIMAMLATSTADLESSGLGDLVRKVISRVIIGVAPFRVRITLLITYLLSPLPLQVDPKP